MADEQYEGQAAPPQAPPKLPRPQSTIAQSFAADLDSMFGLNSDPAVEDLSRTVEQKKHTVTTGQTELQELEARLRETEERLARASRRTSPSRQADAAASRDSKQSADAALKPSPLALKPTFPDSRPATAERPQSGTADAQNIINGTPGALPATSHQNGNNEYVMVDRSDGSAQRGFG